MNRREFLEILGIGIVGGKFVYGSIKDSIKGVREWQIYNELPNYIYNIETEGIVEEVGKNEVKGKGILVNNHFITCVHVTDISNVSIPTPFGIMNEKFKIISKDSFVEGNRLEELIFDEDRDIAVYKLCDWGNKKGRKEIKNFPCKPSSERYLGKKVYIVGNPRLGGKNIRNARISDLDSWNANESSEKDTKYCFGIDSQLIPGDSGTPCVSEDFELMGINSIGTKYGISYVTKIEEFLKC